MPLEQATARIAGFLASEANVAVILQRRAKSPVQMLLWDLDDDSVLAGQWLSAHVDLDACNLSPDGRFFVGSYIDYSGSRPDVGVDYHYGWTALSRPPFFTALAFWPHPGGGVWESRVDLQLGYRLGAEPEKGSLPPWLRVHTLPERWPFTEHSDHGSDVLETSRSVYLQRPQEASEEIRLRRDGWERDPLYIDNRWRKTFATGHLGLRPGIGRELLTAIDLDGRVRLSIANSTGATYFWGFLDIDHRGRLIYEDKGFLWAWADFPQGTPQMVADLNENRFEAIPPPDWAREWPSEPAA